MSFYPDMLVPPKSGVKSYLVKVNTFGEVVVERVLDDAPIISSSRDMAVMGKLSGVLDAINEMLCKAKSPFQLIEELDYYSFGCHSWSELCERINSPKTNFSKRMFYLLPYELRPRNIVRDEATSTFIPKKTPESE